MKTQPNLLIWTVSRPFLKTVVLIAVIIMPLMFLTQCQTKKASISDVIKPTFHSWAPAPPMGWNSWDCYGPTVVEDEVKANADYMAAHLKNSDGNIL